VLYSLLKILGRIILLLFFKLDIKGGDKVPKEGPLVIAINHISPMDPPLLGVIFPRKIHFFAAKELFHIPVVGWVIKHLGVIPVDRRQKDFRSLKKAIELLKKGEVVAIFPQGGIPRPDSPNRYNLKPGVAYLAKKTQSPILCVCVSGTDKAIPRGTKFFRKVFVPIKVEYKRVLYVWDRDVSEILKDIEKEIFSCEDTYN